MNMSAYQKFVRMFEVLYNEEDRLEPLPQYSQQDKSKYYKKIGANTPEEQAELREDRTNQMLANIMFGMEKAKFFEMDKIEKRLLLLTSAPTDKRIIQKIRLPFDHIFLDVDIDSSEIDAKVEFDKCFGILISRVPDGRDGETYVVAFAGQDNDVVFINDILIPIKKSDKLKIHYHTTDDVKFFRDFIINLILFINNPEVEFVQKSRNNERRVRQKKRPLPISNMIKLTGHIKRYADSIRGSIGDGFDHKFWVKGHYRIYRSERYTDMRDKVQWIQPFVKGKGDLVEKVYSLQADKKDKKRYSDNFIFLDDIEAGTKALRDIRNEQR